MNIQELEKLFELPKLKLNKNQMTLRMAVARINDGAIEGYYLNCPFCKHQTYPMDYDCDNCGRELAHDSICTVEYYQEEVP